MKPTFLATLAFLILSITGLTAFDPGLQNSPGITYPIQIDSDLKVIAGQFGVLRIENGELADAEPTTKIPYKIGETYGWIIVLKSEAAAVDVEEVFTLPQAPEQWTSSHETKISDDRRTATTTSKMKLIKEPEDDDPGTAGYGVILRMWTIVEGDPTGVHMIKVAIEGEKVLETQFELIPPDI